LSQDELLEALRALPKKVQRGPALLEAEPFRELVALLAERDDAELFALARGDDALLARAALEALAGRDGDAEPLLELAGTVRPRTAPFLLRALDRRVPEGLVSRLLAAAGDAWWGAPLDDLRALIRRRDEEVSVRAVPDDQIDRAITLVDRLGDALPDSVAKALEERRWERDTARELGRIGRVWRPAGAAELTAGLLRDQPFDRDVAAIASALRNERPLLVVGEPGTGRTRRLRAAAGTIAARDWLVLEAGAAEVNAGMSYIGELEGRMRRLGEVLRGKRVAWLIPDFEALLWAGTHRHSATGILDLLLQLLEGGRISLAGEITPAAYERLLRARPAIRDAFEPLRVAPADEPRTLALAREWVSASAPGTDDAVLREAMALGRHFLRAGGRYRARC
jgi:ATP-dependent Clp protease ATP-binding subunit ClpC